jgi:site-specific DNA recombinase
MELPLATKNTPVRAVPQDFRRRSKKGIFFARPGSILPGSHCKRRGVLKEAHIFTDIFTGTYWRERPGLQAMLTAARRHEFDYLYISELDRLARDVIAQEFVREELKYYGVTTITLKKEEHADDDSVVGQMARYFWGLMAQEERKKIIFRTQRGRRSRVKEGNILAGRRPLYGYVWVDKTVMREGMEVLVSKAAYALNFRIIVTDVDGFTWTEASVVSYVFSLAKRGTPIRRIATILTEKGIPTPEGKALWRISTVCNILSNPFYMGKATAYTHQFTWEPGVGKRMTIRPVEEQAHLPQGAVPAIVDEETFALVQERLVKNKLEAARNNSRPHETLLRCGMIYCGYCNMKMSVTRSTNRGRADYRCNRAARGYGECKCTQMAAHILDSLVWQRVVEVIRNPSLVATELAKKRQEDPTKGAIQAAETILSQTIQKIINLTEALEETTDKTARHILTGRLDELAKQKAGYEEIYDTLLRQRINWEEAERALLEFEKWCDAVRSRLIDPEYKPTYEEKRNACEKIGIRVVLWRVEHDPRLTIEVGPPDIVSTFSK